MVLMNCQVISSRGYCLIQRNKMQRAPANKSDCGRQAKEVLERHTPE